MGNFVSFGGAMKSIAKGGSIYSGSAIKAGLKTPLGILSPVRAFGGMKKHAGSVIRGLGGDATHAKQMAANSMRLLGTAAGVTYGVRAIKGQSLFRNKRGKRDVMPFVPFI